MKNEMLSWYHMHELSQCCVELHQGYANEILKCFLILLYVTV